MKNFSACPNKIKNIDSPFTELLSILKRYENVPSGFPELSYNTHELKIIYHHVDNVMDVLLRGMQSLGHLMGVAPDNEIKNINDIGFFISVITNLQEALNNLRSDVDYVLSKRKEEHF